MRSIVVQRVSDSEWRIVENATVIVARCAFKADADRIALALLNLALTAPPVEQAVPQEPKDDTDAASACAMCHGPYQFDTTIPSVIWNRVVRAQNLPEYLCLTCIVKVFARDKQSFTAELWGDDFNGTPIEVRVSYQSAKAVEALNAENNELRLKIRQMESTIAVLTTPEVVKLAQGLDDIRHGRIAALSPAPPDSRLRKPLAITDDRTREPDFDAQSGAEELREHADVIISTTPAQPDEPKEP